MKFTVYVLSRTGPEQLLSPVVDCSLEKIRDVMAEAYADAINSLAVGEYDADSSYIQEMYARLVAKGERYEWHIDKKEVEVGSIAACTVVKNEKVVNVCIGTVGEMMVHADVSTRDYGPENGVSQILVVKQDSDGSNEIMLERLPEDFKILGVL